MEEPGRSSKKRKLSVKARKKTIPTDRGYEVIVATTVVREGGVK